MHSFKNLDGFKQKIRYKTNRLGWRWIRDRNSGSGGQKATDGRLEDAGDRMSRHQSWREGSKAEEKNRDKNCSRVVRKARRKGPGLGHPAASPLLPSPHRQISSASLTASLHNIRYLLVVFRSGAENGQFWPTRFRFGGFTRINETHDERLQMLTFLLH